MLASLALKKEINYKKNIMAKKIPNVVKGIQESPKRELNYAYQKNISYSQYSMWKKCPKQWSLQYREGNKKYIPSIHTVFGKAFHETLQHYIEVTYNVSGAEADRVDIEGMLKDKLREHYKDEYTKNKSQHFTTPGELGEFYNDGVEILEFIKKRKGQFYTKRGWYLVGIETPILCPPNSEYPNVLYMGYLDVVFYHEPTNTFKIIDIKTSTKGWNDYTKKDEEKQFQLILYKNYFAKQYNIPKENIEIEFFIVKRKIYENSQFPQRRVQEFSPPSGKIKTSRAVKSINEFINDCFIKTDGKQEYTTKEMLPQASRNSCFFCNYKKDDELCGLGACL